MVKETKKIVPPSRKRLARSERERRINRIIVTLTAVVVVVSAVALIAVLIADIAQENQVVAVVGEDQITVKEFIPRVEYQRYLLINQFQQYYNIVVQMAAYPDLQASYVNQMATIEFQLEPYTLGREVINTMVDELIIRHEAEKLGITVTDEEIEAEMQAAFGYLSGPTEVPAEIPTLMPTSTLSELQLSLVTLTPIPTTVPSPTLDLTATKLAEETVESEDGETVVEPTPTLIDLGPTPTATPYTQELYDANVKNYLDSVDAFTSYSEEDLRLMFENQLYREKLMAEISKSSLPVEEQVWARHILVEDSETADIVMGLLNGGGDFAAIAAMYSTDTGSKVNGGDVGWFNFTRMVNEFAVVAFNQDIGEISDPVQSQFGFHIIQTLGHEDRPLTSEQFDIKKIEDFESWLETERIAVLPVIYDTWVDVVPSTLEIPADWRDQLLQLLMPPTQEEFVEPQPTLEPSE